MGKLELSQTLRFLCHSLTIVKQAPYKEFVAIRDQWSIFLSTFPMGSWGYIYVCLCVFLSHIHKKEIAYAERIISPFHG